MLKRPPARYDASHDGPRPRARAPRSARHQNGLVVRVRRAKGDQEGRGAKKGIPYGPRETIAAARAGR